MLVDKLLGIVRSCSAMFREGGGGGEEKEKPQGKTESFQCSHSMVCCECYFANAHRQYGMHTPAHSIMYLPTMKRAAARSSTCKHRHSIGPMYGTSNKLGSTDSCQCQAGGNMRYSGQLCASALEVNGTSRIGTHRAIKDEYLCSSLAVSRCSFYGGPREATGALSDDGEMRSFAASGNTAKASGGDSRLGALPFSRKRCFSGTPFLFLFTHFCGASLYQQAKT